MRREGLMSDRAIVYTLENSYLNAFMVSVYSLLKYNNSINSDIVVIYNDDCILEKLKIIEHKINKKIIKKKITENKYIESRFKSINREWKFNPAYRFELFNLTEYESILYIDCDTLILGDISELLDNNCDFGACLLSPTTMKFYSQGNGFNAGVLKIGKRYLIATVKEKLIKYCLDKKNLSGNQIVLNTFFHDKKTLLPQKYNVTTDLLTEKLLKEGIIFHFIGENKPIKNKFSNSYNNYVRRNTGIGLLSILYIKYKLLEKECSSFFSDIW